MPDGNEKMNCDHHGKGIIKAASFADNFHICLSRPSDLSSNDTQFLLFFLSSNDIMVLPETTDPKDSARYDD